MAGGRFRAASAALAGLFARARSADPARRASALALLIRLANAALVYFAQVVLARLLGPAEYGVFAFVFVWFTVLGAVVAIGLGESTIRILSDLTERGDEEALRGYLRFAPRAAFASACTIALLVAAGVLLARPFIDPAYVAPMLLMAAILPVGGQQTVLEGVGRSRFWTLSALLPVYIFRHAFLLAFTLAALALGAPASAVTVTLCLGAAVAASFAWQAREIMPRMRASLGEGKRAYAVRQWLWSALPFGVTAGTSQLSTFADVLVLSFLVGPAELAVYFAATRVIQAVSLIPYAATIGAAPLYAARFAAGDKAGLAASAREVTLWTFGASLAAALLIALAGPLLLGLFGAGFTAGYPSLLLLAAGILARVACGPAEDLLAMTGHGRLVAAALLAALALSVPLTVALVGKYGIEGAAAAASITLALRSAFLALAVRRRLGFDATILAAGSSLVRARATG